MVTVTPGQFTFAGGEQMREMGGRVDLASYYTTVLKSENFEVDAQGQLRFRGGSNFVSVTKSNTPAAVVPFVFSVLQSYVLEFTSMFMRIYKDRGIIESSPGVPLEVATPWGVNILFEIRYDQDVDVMYLTHGTVKPYKITRTAHTAWTCQPVVLIDGPFLPINTTTTTFSLSGTGLTATATASAATFVATDVGRQLRFKDPAGAWHWYVISGFTSTTIVSVTRGSATIAPSAGTATTLWRFGVFSDTTGWPVACQFYEKRMYYLKDQVLYGSKAASQALDYDTFTEGTDADSPVTYVLPGANSGRWLQEAQTFLGIGTFGSVRRASGGGTDDPITPTSISIKSVGDVGVAAIQPILTDRNIIYVARDGKTVLSIEFDALQEGYVTRNRNITAQHITRDGIKQMAYQFGGSAKIWMAILNGKTAGLTYIPEQQVFGWHSHKTQGDYTSVASIPNVNGGDDEYWHVVKRNLDGVDTYCVEYRADEIVYPDFEDYFTSEDNYDADLEPYLRDLYEAQKQAVHVDCALTYDGRIDTTLILNSPTVGTSRTATVGINTFANTDIGRQLTGAPYGRAIITGYTDAQNVTVDIVTPFDSVSMASGEWYFTTSKLTGFTHLANMTIQVQADGQHLKDLQVDALGQVQLVDQFGLVHGGLGYQGLIVGNIVEGGSRLGTSQAKLKNIKHLAVRFLHTLGPWIGARLYKKGGLTGLSRCEFEKVNLRQGWATPLFTGDFDIPVDDEWNSTKRWYINQRAPLPCKVQMVVPRFENIDG